MQAQDHAVGRVLNQPRSWHTAILIAARNLVAGAAVRSST